MPIIRNMKKDLDKNIVMESLLKGYGRLFDVDSNIEEPLFKEVIENMQKSQAQRISQYWVSVGGYISDSMDKELLNRVAPNSDKKK